MPDFSHLQHRLNALPQSPGVYQMLDADGQVLYVGKAKNLARRVASYFQNSDRLSRKNQAMVAQVRDLDIALTHTEKEALLLECSLIKSHQPRYNILLRDDKSFPYLCLNTHTYPRLSLHRGQRNPNQGEYFGPYPSAHKARRTLALAQKLFRIRSCSDTDFKQRQRPCLEHQMQRCSAPCVQKISEHDYQQQIQCLRALLRGETSDLLLRLRTDMEQAATELQFEQAVRLRDQISLLSDIRSRENITHGTDGHADVIALSLNGHRATVHWMVIRNGQPTRTHSHRMQRAEQDDTAAVMAAFIAQRYFESSIPNELILSHAPDDAELLTETLSTLAGHGVRLNPQPRAHRRRWLELAQMNADYAAGLTLLTDRDRNPQRLASLSRLVGRPTDQLRHMICIDISHHGGANTVASIVAFNHEGADKKNYRYYRLANDIGGDDCAAMQAAMQRHIQHIMQQELPHPDLVLVDGAAPQLSTIAHCFTAQIDHLPMPLLLSLSKGPNRDARYDKLWHYSADSQHANTLPDHQQPEGQLWLQAMRDEAHRFAIRQQRQQQRKKQARLPLDDIPGIGPSRKQTLLQHFGGLKPLRQAAMDDLKQLPGFNQTLAERVWQHLHP